MPPAAATVWAGIDVGKTHHWVEVVDDCGASLLSRRVLNDQTEIDALIAAIVALAETVRWAVDIVGSRSALLTDAGQQVRYASGRGALVLVSGTPPPRSCAASGGPVWPRGYGPATSEATSSSPTAR